MNNFTFQNFINEQNELNEVVNGLTQNQAHTRQQANRSRSGFDAATQRAIQQSDAASAAYQAKRAAKQQQRAKMTPQARAQADAVANQERIARNERLGLTIPDRTPIKIKRPSILGGMAKALPGAFAGEVNKQMIQPVVSGDPWAIAGLASTFVPVVGPAVKIGKAAKSIAKSVKSVSKLTRSGRSAKSAAAARSAATTNAAAVAQTAAQAAKPAAAVAQAAKPAAAVAATGKAAKAAKAAIGRPHIGGPLGASAPAAGTAAKIGRGVKRVLARGAGEMVPLTWLRSGEVIRGAKMAKRMGKQILGRAGGRSARGTGAAQIAKRLAARTAKQSGKRIAITHAKRAAINYALNKGLDWGADALLGGEGEQGGEGQQGGDDRKDSGSDIKAKAAKKRRKETEAEMYRNKNKKQRGTYKLPDEEEDDKKDKKNESVEQVMQQISTGKNFGGWTDEHNGIDMKEGIGRVLAGGVKNFVMKRPKLAAALGLGASTATWAAMSGSPSSAFAARALDAVGGGQQGGRDAGDRETGADIAAGQLSRGGAWDDKHRNMRAGMRSSGQDSLNRAMERQAKNAMAAQRRKENLRQG